MALFERWLEETSSISHADRPLVTISYAQATDGSIAAQRGQPTAISGPESLVYTHRLRAAHDAILVGIGTVLSDDPQLNVRLVEGKDPRVIVLDCSLRIPLKSRMMSASKKPWIFAGQETNIETENHLIELGAKVNRVDSQNGYLVLRQMLSNLHRDGIRSVMVEGGGLVLGSFLREGLADRAMITVSPEKLGGYKVGPAVITLLQNAHTETAGKDKIVFGHFELQPQ